MRATLKTIAKLAGVESAAHAAALAETVPKAERPYLFAAIVERLQERAEDRPMEALRQSVRDNGVPGLIPDEEIPW